MKLGLLLTLMMLGLIVTSCARLQGFGDNGARKVNSPVEVAKASANKKLYDIAWDSWNPGDCSFFRIDCETAKADFPVSYRTEEPVFILDGNRPVVTIPASRNIVKGN